jgi:predicted flap endonuclease-1-like 5' DNA nuclease
LHPAPPPPRSVEDAFRRAGHDVPGDVGEEPVSPSSPPPAEPVAPPPPTDVAPPISAAVAVATAAARVLVEPVDMDSEPDDLTRIRAIDQPLAAKLNELGVNRYAEIAGWTADDVQALSELLGFKGRIEHENWIEQAQILSRGEQTSYASTLARVAAPVVMVPAPAGEPEVAARAAFAEARIEELASVPAPATAGVAGRDALQRIGGISAEIEDLLNEHGVTRYSQISGWGRADIERLEQLLGTSGRISRENWIEQAQILAKGGSTAYSRKFDGIDVEIGAPASAAPAAASAVELKPGERSQILSGMRSVRSEAFRGPDSLAPSEGAADDLKRIRGIGVLIETKLNAMGVTTYEQIANWTADDVATVAHKLDFKGRIERENWIEQARILASGGHTDFSRRFERGEV